MVSASFLDDRIVQRWKFVRKNGISQIHYCRKNMAFCNTCEQAEKTVYGLSFLLDDKIVQNGNMPKKRDQAFSNVRSAVSANIVYINVS